MKRLLITMVAVWGLLAVDVTPLRRATVILLAMLTLAGCNTTPERPAPPPAPIVCAASVGMTGQEPEPDRPQGEYTQRDVALYVTDLHGWGAQGWKQLAAVRRHEAECIDDHTSDEPRE